MIGLFYNVFPVISYLNSKIVMLYWLLVERSAIRFIPDPLESRYLLYLADFAFIYVIK